VFEPIEVSGKTPTALTNTLAAFFHQCDNTLAPFNSHASFSKDAQASHKDTRLSELFLAAIPLQFRLSFQRKMNLPLDDSIYLLSYNELKDQLLKYAVLLEFKENMATWFRFYYLMKAVVAAVPDML
jgi:hypothetical protein